MQNTLSPGRGLEIDPIAWIVSFEDTLTPKTNKIQAINADLHIQNRSVHHEPNQGSIGAISFRFSPKSLTVLEISCSERNHKFTKEIELTLIHDPLPLLQA
jgi:hypothetical protein